MRPLEQFQFSFILFVIFHRHFTQKKERHRRRKSRKKLYKIKKIKKFTQDSLYSFKKWKSRANFFALSKNSGIQLSRKKLPLSLWLRFKIQSNVNFCPWRGFGARWRLEGLANGRPSDTSIHLDKIYMLHCTFSWFWAGKKYKKLDIKKYET